MKIRLLMRKGIADQNGTCVEYVYSTQVVEIKEELSDTEVIGAEFLREADNEDS